MYEVEFYYDRNGNSAIVEYLDELNEAKQAKTSVSTVIKSLRI